MHETNLRGMSRMSEPRLEGKTHDIPKRMIWDAWLKVKGNGGAAGADGVTIEQFESRLKENLYKLWNRMSSGSYFVSIQGWGVTCRFEVGCGGHAGPGGVLDPSGSVGMIVACVRRTRCGVA
jgi:hypothetical protein